MKIFKLIYVIVFFSGSTLISQVEYTSIDSLFTHTFKTLNQRDSVSYFNKIDLHECLLKYKIKSKKYSLEKVNSIYENYRILLDEFADMTFTSKPTIEYLNYTVFGKNTLNEPNTKLNCHVSVLINNQFTIKLPVFVVKQNNNYLLGDALIAMFVVEN